MSKNRRTALALQRAIFADKQYPRLRRAARALFERHVREFASRVADGRGPEIPQGDQERWTRELAATLRPQIISMAEHGWNLAAVEVGAVAGKAVKVGGRAREFLARADFSRINLWIKQTSESATLTTSTRLENMFARAAANVTGDADHPVGVTPRELSDEILKSGIVISESRAKMLAHTGSIWSYNEGAVLRYEDAGVAVVEWLTADDDMRCPFCAEMNGKRIETGEPFFRSGDTFSFEDRKMKIPTGARGFDVRHPPLHPNCRCTLVPVFDETL